MPVVTFTARFVDSLAPPSAGQCDYWDRALPGFGLRVSFGGRRAWVVRYHTNSRLRRLTLGPFPTIGLADARDRAKLALLQAASGADPATAKRVRGHDLRRTAASQMTSMGIPRLVVAKILNHVETDVTAVYDRHSYDAEKRWALDVWARQLQKILRSRRRNKVLPFDDTGLVQGVDQRRESA
jgi:integrase